ncbi:hypothetical protein CR513_57611, partial [Mucuna pruriens]
MEAIRSILRKNLDDISPSSVPAQAELILIDFASSSAPKPAQLPRHSWEKLAAQVMQGSWIERPKVVRGDCLACRRTLVDLILSALVKRGEPSPLSMAIVVEDDPEIELTLRRLRKARNIVVSDSSNSVSSSDNSTPVTNISNSVEFTSTNNSVEQMENNNERTLKELATLDIMYQPWCIQYPQFEPAQTYELKSGLMMMDQSMVDSASGRALMDKKSAATRHLISNMASNAQQFRIKGASQS